MTLQLVVIDPSVREYAAWSDSLNLQRVDILVLDPLSDGLLQIASYLNAETRYEAIHLVSHGAAGLLRLGQNTLSLAHMATEAGLLTQIGAALTEDGDILIYGCDVASGEKGKQFIDELATWTGADVSASLDTSGPLDGELEASTGQIEAISLDLGLLATTLAANTAPVLTSQALSMAALTEDEANPGGQTVLSLLGGQLSDADGTSLQGLALFSTSGSNGKWQYRLAGSVSWVDVGQVSPEAALLLRDTDWLRWLPDGSNGTTASLSYHGWDQSSGAAGERTSVSTRGASSAFSLTSHTASLTVSSVNDAPLLVCGGFAALVGLRQFFAWRCATRSGDGAVQ